MAPKRKAQDTPEATGSRRRSTRLSSSAGAKKSKYFEDKSDDEISQAERTRIKANSRAKTASKENVRPGRKSTGNKGKKEESEDEDAYDDEEAAAEDDGEDAYDDKEAAPAEEDDDEEEYDSDAPPKVTFIPLPKLRDTGGVPYTDETLHKNTMLFLKDLKAHNERPWLKCKLLYPQTYTSLLIAPSPRRGVPPRPQRLGILRHHPHLSPR